MAHLLVDGDVGPHGAGRLDAGVLEILGVAQQNGHAQLVVQEAALDIAALCDAGAGLEADDVAHGYAQLFGVFPGPHVLIQHDLHGAPVPLGIIVLAVDVDGGVNELAGALQNSVELGDHPDVLALGIVGVHAAQPGDLQPSVGLDLADHAAQGVCVGLQQQAAAFAAGKLYQHAALDGQLRGVAQIPEPLADQLRRLGRVAGGRVHRQQLHGALHDVIGVLLQIDLFHSSSLSVR